MNKTLQVVADTKAERGADVICIVRVEDFWEAYGADAEVLAGEPCHLTLTSRRGAEGTRVPMAGFPHHALSRYLRKLIEAGHRVAVCEVPKG